MGFNYLKTAQTLLEDNLLVITKSPEVPGTHLINLKRMEGWVPTTPSFGIKRLNNYASLKYKLSKFYPQ